MYAEHFRAFSQNINFAARILHYYLNMSAKAGVDEADYNALNKTARFWNDYNFMALQTVIIFLGKIFDSQNRTHNLQKLLDVLPESLEHFSKANLKVRKIKTGAECNLDEYLKDAHELTKSDIALIEVEAEKAKDLWKKFEPLRHRFYAHNQMLTDKQRDELFKGATYDELEDLVQILLNIEHVLDQAEINGRQPDFSYENRGPINRAEGETDRLLNLLKGSSLSETNP